MIEKQKIVDLYTQYHNESVKQYGSKTAVLMECGNFFEMYSKEDDPIIMKQIAKDLNLQMTRRSKEKHALSAKENSYMSGFQKFQIDRYISILQEKNYTIVMVEEQGLGPDYNRVITNIISPGTKMDLHNNDSNYLMCIYITTYTNKFKHNFNYYAVSIIDVSTGKLIVYENENVYNFIHSYKPNEIIFYNLTEIDIESIINDLDLHNISFNEHKEFNKMYLKNSYENEFFKKIYKDTGLLSPIEYLDLEMFKDTITCLILLLEYVNKLSPVLINNLDKPIIWDNSDILELRNNTIYQLNIVKNNTIESFSKINCLLDVIDKTNTAMGSREFRNNVLNPILNEDKLNSIYDFVENLKSNHQVFTQQLKNILDVERGNRKLILNMIKPHEFSKYDESYICIIKLLTIINENYKDTFNNILNIEIEDSIQFMEEFYEKYNSTYDTQKMRRYGPYDTSINFFKEGNYVEIDNVENEIIEAKQVFKDLREKCVNLCKNKDKSFDIKFENKSKEGHVLTITEKRSKLLKKLITDKKEFEDIKIEKKNNIVFVTSNLLKEKSNKLILLSDKLSHLIRIKYKDSILKYKDDKYINNFKLINKIIRFIDIYNSYAKVAVLNNYCRPIITNKNTKSYLKCYDLRHPIIEKIQKNLDYVPNDIELSDDKEDGILLFGPNAAGKSSVMKSIGIAIIMAQCGMFVPCSRMIYYPYKRLFSRIIGSDNLFKGQSSFAVEMIEIKTILQHSDNNSLILGDEICRGTEDLSAISLVASLIKKLSQKMSSFIFTTHLHKLPELTVIKSLSNVKSYHLTIDIQDNKIIYLRKIKEGQGDTIYGIEIAKYIVHDDEFIIDANSIRNEIENKTDELIGFNTSNYNSDVIINKCMMPECQENAVDTHHIKFQENADENNFIDHIHKNNDSNLIGLCKKHHEDVHNDKLIIDGYVKTTKGVELNYNYVEKTKIVNNRKKYSDEQVKDFVEYISDKCDNVLNGNTVNEIKKEFNIKISKNTLQKMIDKVYF